MDGNMDSSPVLRESDRDNQPASSNRIPQVKGGGADAWEHIRELDEVENWTERNRVVSKADHVYYVHCAQEFVEDLLTNAVSVSDSHLTEQATPTVTRPPTLTTSPTPTSHVSDEFQYMTEFTDQDFQASATQFDVDFLERVSSSTSEPSALTRESLYVKFDPLVKGPSPKLGTHHKTPHIASAGKIGTHPRSTDLLMMDTPPRSSSSSSRHSQSILSSRDLLTGSPSLPEVSPTAEDFMATPRSSRLNSTLLDGSPLVVDHSHQDTPTSPPVPTPSRPANTPFHDLSSIGVPETDELVKVLKFGDEDVRQMVEAARQEEREKFEEQLAAMREELSHRETSLKKEASHRETGAQKRVDRAQRECQGLKAEVALHVADKAKLEEEVERWKQLVASHDKTQTDILEKYDELKGQVKKLEGQRDQALTDFESLEKAFADLHQRYLKLKTTSQSLQKNEEDLKKYIKELEEGNRAAEERFKQLQLDVQGKMDEANQTFDSLKREHTSEVAVTKANVKKLMLQVASLERALQQKEQEKQELSQICDDLMKELGNR